MRTLPATALSIKLTIKRKKSYQFDTFDPVASFIVLIITIIVRTFQKPSSKFIFSRSKSIYIFFFRITSGSHRRKRFQRNLGRAFWCELRSK
jgi:hypothetical protein